MSIIFCGANKTRNNKNLQNSHHPKVIWSHGEILLHCCKWSSPRALGLETLAFWKTRDPSRQFIATSTEVTWNGALVRDVFWSQLLLVMPFEVFSNFILCPCCLECSCAYHVHSVIDVITRIPLESFGCLLLPLQALKNSHRGEFRHLLLSSGCHHGGMEESLPAESDICRIYIIYIFFKFIYFVFRGIHSQG